MRFLVKWPTRSRAAIFCDALRCWIDNLSGQHDVRFLVNQDSDDPSRFRVYESFLWRPGPVLFLPNRFPCGRLYASLEFIEGACKSKIEAVNYGVFGSEFDILISASDDMLPQVPGYDDVIARAMERSFPMLDGALYFWDGSPRKEFLSTLSVMGSALYYRFGYIYNPEYVSLYADEEYTKVCASAGRLVIPEGYGMGEKCLIRHDHPIYRKGATANYDALMRRNESQKLYDRDKATFDRRQRAGFGFTFLPATGD